MKFSGIILSILTIAALSGCERSSDTAHPSYFKAAQCREAGDYEAAERQLRRFLASRPGSPDGHLALASLYDENLNDLPRAIYHYQEFIRLDTNSPDREMAKAWLKAAENRYRDQLNGNAAISVQETPDNTADIDALRSQNQELKKLLFHQSQELARLKNTPPPAPRRAAPPPRPVQHVTGSQEYTVQSGDTLGRIARRFYGASSKFPLIMKANNLDGSALHIGQKLIIPPLNGE